MMMRLISMWKIAFFTNQMTAVCCERVEGTENGNELPLLLLWVMNHEQQQQRVKMMTGACEVNWVSLADGFKGSKVPEKWVSPFVYEFFSPLSFLVNAQPKDGKDEMEISRQAVEGAGERARFICR
jgi:hypothetical protein